MPAGSPVEPFCTSNLVTPWSTSASRQAGDMMAWTRAGKVVEPTVTKHERPELVVISWLRVVGREMGTLAKHDTPSAVSARVRGGTDPGGASGHPFGRACVAASEGQRLSKMARRYIQAAVVLFRVAETRQI